MVKAAATTTRCTFKIEDPSPFFVFRQPLYLLHRHTPKKPCMWYDAVRLGRQALTKGPKWAYVSCEPVRRRWGRRASTAESPPLTAKSTMSDPIVDDTTSMDTRYVTQ